MNTGSGDSRRTIAVLLLASLLAAHLLFLLLPNVLEANNARVFDRLSAFRASSSRFQPLYDETILHVDLDTESLAELGEFYVGRRHFAQVIRNLGRMGVAAQVYDFVFALPQNVEDDAAMAESIAESGNAYFGVAFELADWGKDLGNDRRNDPGNAGPVPDRDALAAQDPVATTYLADTSWKITVASESAAADFRAGIRPLPTFPQFAQPSRGLGSLSLHPDADGIIRRLPLIVRYGDDFYPSMPLRVICDYLGVSPSGVVLGNGPTLTLKGARKPDGMPADIEIPVDDRGDFLISFVGGWGRMKHVSLWRAYRASEDRDAMEILAEQLKGKIVVVSDVSPTSRDVGPVPTDNTFPLSGLMANVFNNILTRTFDRKVKAPWMLAVEVMLLAGVFGLAIRLKPLAFTTSLAGLIVAYFGAAALLFLYFGRILHVVRPVIMLGVALTLVIAYRYLIEERNKTFLRRTLDAYFPPKVAERMMMNPKFLASGGERKELTIMFSDVVGFTKRSATLPPDRIQEMLNEYFEAMTDIAFKYEGTVDKFMGDGLMVFGDPEPQPDHALRCVRMALEMQKKVREISADWESRGDKGLQIRIGINTGVVVVGNMGSARRLSYTVLGADVNLAQRLESNAPIGGIMISRRTYELLDGAVQVKALGAIHVKGLDEPVEAFEVLLEQA